MKISSLATFLLFLFATTAFAQQKSTGGYLGFDEGDDVSAAYFLYDSSHANNIWRVGKPNKTVFKNGYNSSTCIVTDLTNPYPVNDTSAFIVYQPAFDSWSDPQHAPDSAEMTGYYQVYSDTLTDFGTIEFSPDNGITWIDLLNNTVFNVIRDKPVLTGNSGGWKSFRLNFYRLADSFHILRFHPVLLRFTFISDNIQSNKDGLMYDNFYFKDYFAAVPIINSSKFTSTIYPNPSSSFVNISFETISSHSYSLSVYDCSGRIIRRMEKIKDHKLTLTTNDLPPGMYHYTIRDEQDGKYSDGKFVVVH